MNEQLAVEVVFPAMNKVLKDLKAGTGFTPNRVKSSGVEFSPVADALWSRQLWNLVQLSREVRRFTLWTTIIGLSLVLLIATVSTKLIGPYYANSVPWLAVLNILLVIVGPATSLLMWRRFRPAHAGAVMLEAENTAALKTWLDGQGVQVSDETLKNWGFFTAYYFSSVSPKDNTDRGADVMTGRVYFFRWDENGYTLTQDLSAKKTQQTF